MARRDTTWEVRFGTYIETSSPTWYDVLINGSNKYLNFWIVSWSTWYGFRDNAWIMEYKNSGWSWAPISSWWWWAVDSVNWQTGVVVLDADDISDSSTTNKFATTAEKTKLSFISVTQSVDLDQMETDIAALANGMVYKGNWDASAWTFPWAWVAKIGRFYTVSVAGTVDWVVFNIWDRLIAIVNNASTTTFASNWSMLDATDAVTSVFWQTWNVTAPWTVNQAITSDGAGGIQAVPLTIDGSWELSTPWWITAAYIWVYDWVSWVWRIQSTILTIDRDYYLPDATGNIVLEDNTASLTNKTVNGVVLDSTWPWTDFLANDWTYKTVGWGTPWWSNTQVQFNDWWILGWDSWFTYDKTTKYLNVENQIDTKLMQIFTAGVGGIIIDSSIPWFTVTSDVTDDTVSVTTTNVQVYDWTNTTTINATDVTLWTDDPYDATGRNGSLEVPTKNAIRDKIESMSGGSLTKWIAEVDFWASSQESDIATVTVTDATIWATSYPNVSVYALATTDHDTDDYMAEWLIAYISSVTAGVGFNISVKAPNLTWWKYKVTYSF